MIDRGVERAVLEGITPALQAEGYEVFFQPPPSVLPPFMRGYRPDAVALKPGRNLAIEIRAGSHPARGEEGEPPVRDLFSGHGDWERRVYYAASGGVEPAISVPDRGRIAEMLDKAAALGRDTGGAPALLLAWGVLEAVGRALAPEELCRPQSAARLLEVLASEGYVTPAEAQALRPLGQLRNRVAHGDFSVAVTQEQIERLIATTRTLLSLWPEPGNEA